MHVTLSRRINLLYTTAELADSIVNIHHQGAPVSARPLIPKSGTLSRSVTIDRPECIASGLIFTILCTIYCVDEIASLRILTPLCTTRVVPLSSKLSIMSGDEKFRPGSDDSAHHTSTPDFVSFVNDRLREHPHYHCPRYPCARKPIGETLTELNHICMNFRRAPILELAVEYHASAESKGHTSTTIADLISVIFGCFLVFFSPLMLLLYVLPRAIWVSHRLNWRKF